MTSAAAILATLRRVRDTSTKDRQVHLTLTDGSYVSGVLRGVTPTHIYLSARAGMSRRIPAHHIAEGR